MIAFETVNRAALAALPAVLTRLIPGGKILGHEYVALNPTRSDRRPGSFKINIRTGRWSDFATGIDMTSKTARVNAPLKSKASTCGIETNRFATLSRPVI